MVKMEKGIGSYFNCKVPTKLKRNFIVLLYNQLYYMVVSVKL